MRRDIPLGVIAFSLTILAIAAVHGETPPALAQLAPGQWELQEIDGPLHHTLCVVDPAMLIRLKARNAQCSHAVLNAASASLVMYHSCPGAGQVRSVLTVHTARSIRLEFQGVEHGLPFAETYEGRLIGSCTGGGR